MDGLRKICVCFIILAMIAAAFTLLLRIRTEASSREVDLVVDYNEVVALAGTQGKSVAEVLACLRVNGITGVALPEETLNTLLAQGEINIIPHAEIAPRQALNAKIWAPGAQVFDIQTPGLHANLWLYAALQRFYTPANLAANPPFRISVSGSRDAVANLGLGLSPLKVVQIKHAGLRVIPRLHGSGWVNADSLRASLDAVQQMVATPGKHPYYGTVIFDGTVIPGYRTLIPELAVLLQERKMVYGSIEFGKQKGDDELGARLHGNLVRVHSITADDLTTLLPSQLVQRFALAVKDRNIRVLYVHIPPLAGADARVDAADYARAISSELRREGFGVDVHKPAHPFRELHPPKLLLMFLFLGAGAALLYWVLTVLPAQAPPAVARAAMALFVLGVLVALITGFSAHHSDFGRACFGLLAAISFPLLSLTWAYRAVDHFVAARTAKPLWPAIRALLIATLITMGGALLVAAIMSESGYLVKSEQFSGVKLALGVPLLFFFVLIAADAVARHGEEWSAYCARCRQQVLSFCRQPLYIWSITLVMVTLTAVVLLLARSGNDSGVGVSNFELHMRSVLEQWMYARPRTKEFAFGHPLFIFAMIAAARGYRLPALLLLLGAAVGQTDVLNTYCHAHTGLLLSLVRTFNGLWLGIAIAVALLALFARRALANTQREKAPVQ